MNLGKHQYSRYSQKVQTVPLKAHSVELGEYLERRAQLNEVTFRAIESKELVPSQWEHLADSSLSVFNMALVALDEGYLVAYRFVSAVDLKRRIATCLLDSNFQVVPGSAKPFSDHLRFAATEVSEQSKQWFADPRLFELKGELYLVWNNGHTDDDFNQQFLVKVSGDSALPVEPARELVLRAARRKTEKNWALFEADNQIWAVYSANPHIILKVDLDSSDTEVLCDIDNLISWKSKYSEIFGFMRGGAQPIRYKDGFLNVVHSRYNMHDGVEYVPALYEFSAKYPFAPISELVHPIDLGFDPHSDATQHGFVDSRATDLNPTTSWVVYPTGFAIRGEQCVITGGYNDSHCFIATGKIESLTHSMVKVKATMQPKIKPVGSVDVRNVAGFTVAPIAPKLPLFWWEAKNRSMSPNINNQLFKFGNFGDEASEQLVAKLTGSQPRQALPGDRKLLAIGSVLHRAQSGDIIWGSGLKSEAALDDHPGGDILVTAVRGPMTLDVLKKNGWDVSRVTEMFDPGVLMQHLWASELKKQSPDANRARGKIRILPHFRDEIVFKRWHFDHLNSFISADNDPITVMKQMLGAEIVYSTSLHGIIFAESLGIPAIWIDSPGKEGHFKYLDYYAGTGRAGIKAAANLSEAFKMSPPELPTFEVEKLLATFPAKEIAELASSSQPAVEGLIWAATGVKDFERRTEINFTRQWDEQPEAIWVKAKSASLTVMPMKLPRAYGTIKLQLRTCDMRLSTGNQQVTVTTSAGSQAVLNWSSGDLRAKEIILPIDAASMAQGLTIHLKATKVGPQLSWKNPTRFGSVGIVSIRSN